ncbi:MAG: DUF2339 domain-containing protein, partial [Solirubrobacteraceae bacterium]
MSNNKEITDLLNKINLLEEKQGLFSKEILSLKIELLQLKNKSNSEFDTKDLIASKEIDPKQEKSIIKIENQSEFKKDTNVLSEFKEQIKLNLKTLTIKNDIEKFIGENLLNIIGFLIRIFGVVFGTKYSIENNLLSPLTRIILGFLFSISLLFVGIKLKEKYKNYRAVLVSGSIASMYFITYAAYNFYSLIPFLIVFLLLLSFTIFITIAALNYNIEIIAIIGLVGSYAVPFLV